MPRNGSPLTTILATLALLFPAFVLPSGPAAALELEDCRISAGPSFPSIKARCGTLERPLNPDDAASPTLALRVAVVPAQSVEPEPDPVVPIAGGPGQGTVEFFASWSGAFEELRRDRDILLLDQRGTGESARLDCGVDDELVEGQYSVDETARYTKECLDALPYDPQWFTTSIAVRDLEALRQALGYPSLNLYGVSYGSRVAQHFARRYPDSTRTVVLDGVVPPQLPLGPQIATESQVAIERIFTRCAADPACDERFPNLANRFAELRARLAEKPAKVRAADPLTGEVEQRNFGPTELAVALRLLAYHASTIAMVPLLVSEAADGNYRPLVAQYLMTASELNEQLALGMHNSVMCSEDVPYYDDEYIDHDAINASYIGPTQLEALKAICSVWPEGPMDADFHEPLSTRVPVLLLSGDSDPITPPRYADMAAMNLMKAWLLTGRNQGHGQLAVGCTAHVVSEFVTNASLDGVDADCVQANFAMPFFLDYGGPAP